MRLHRDAKIDLMARVPLFAQCSRAQLAEIAQIADEMDFPAGKALIREGEPGREFFVLLEGEVEVTRDGQRIAMGHGGDFFGEIALVTDSPRTATVTTTTNVDVLVVTDRAFRELMRRSPEIQLQVLQALAERLSASML